MTDPMTPAECDLRGLPFMPLDVVRLGDSDLVALSSGDEFKAAVILWCKSWLQVPGASLPDDDRVLAHLTGLGPRWKKVRDMALHGWVKCSDGRLYHPVVAEKAREAWKHRLSQRDRANKRWHNSEREPGNAAADATAYPAVMQGTGRGTVTPDKSGVAPQRANRLPADFIVPEDWIEWATSDRGWPRREAIEEAKTFVDYWRAKPGKDGTKLDWLATWRNWCRNSRRVPQRAQPAIPI